MLKINTYEINYKRRKCIFTVFEDLNAVLNRRERYEGFSFTSSCKMDNR